MPHSSEPGEIETPDDEATDVPAADGQDSEVDTSPSRAEHPWPPVTVVPTEHYR